MENTFTFYELLIYSITIGFFSAGGGYTLGYAIGRYIKKDIVILEATCREPIKYNMVGVVHIKKQQFYNGKSKMLTCPYLDEENSCYFKKEAKLDNCKCHYL